MPIKHIFVLMMENRSFDHLLGYSGIAGVTPPDPMWGTLAGADDPAACDPSHEYEDVRAQIAGTPPMSGFKTLPYWDTSRQGFRDSQLTVLGTLAARYFLFDNWFSSMPGPTWPNRFFVHAASSGGLDNSPSSIGSLGAATDDSLSFSFQNGTIFDRLTAKGKKWRVYHDDLFPQVLAIKGMIDPFRLNTEQFSWLRLGGADFFARDLCGGYDVDYTFIEPNHAVATGGVGGNSEHPKGAVADGEAFIQYVYESIRNSPVWPDSLLVITFDEHGGFFDHVAPLATVPPGDDDRNHDKAQNPQDCAFNTLGVRVPTVVISPWLAAGGLGSRAFPGKCFDHSAIIRTIWDVFSLGGAPGSLTNRDAAMVSFAGLCSLTSLRTDPNDVPTSLNVAASPAPRPATTLVATPVDAPPDGTTRGFQRIAANLDRAMAAEDSSQPVATSHPAFASASRAAGAPTAAAPAAPIPTAEPSDRLMRDYIRKVAEKHYSRTLRGR
jgi:phospholipase C